MKKKTLTAHKAPETEHVDNVNMLIASKSEGQADTPSISAALLRPMPKQAQGYTLGFLGAPSLKSYIPGKQQNEGEAWAGNEGHTKLS